ncbi:MAG: sel1 repeat family protein [Marinilabiliaceae bacterium]|nr:sel1 repeat family protein [Marinilabiliaceae bacterium]
MAMKYCETHDIWYNYKEGCPECTKVGRIVGNVVGGVVGGAIYGIGWAGKKIYDSVKEKNVEKKKDFSETKARIQKSPKDLHKEEHRIHFEKKLALANQGDVETQFEVGKYYYYGLIVVEKNIEKAFEWFLRAAEQGHAEANFFVGSIHSEQKNYSEALKYYRRAEARGEDLKDVIQSTIKAKKAHESVQRMREEPVKEYEWEKEAYTRLFDEKLMLANQGNAEAQYELGLWYRFGCGGVTKDTEEALEWFLKAADCGHIEADLYAGEIYVNLQNYSEALKCYRRAESRGKDVGNAIQVIEKAALYQRIF